LGNIKIVMAFFKNIIKTKKGDKPNLPRQLFWDWDFEKIDWEKGCLSIIARVIERGVEDEWKELIRYYGEPKVVKALKSEIKYLPDFAIVDVCSYFKLKKEDLACYPRKQSRHGHWI
jgi:hypothetical protein